MQWVRHMTRTPYKSAAAPMSHSAADSAEFNVVCRSKSNLPNRTDSNAALLPYLQYRSKVSWHSKLEPWDSILEPRCSKRSRIESWGSRNKAFSNMQKLERVSRKRFISRRKNNTVLLTPKVQTFCVDRYRMKTFEHTIADYPWVFSARTCFQN